MAFAPMLASPADLDNTIYPVWASPKLDGIRCLIKGHQPLSRSLKVIPNAYVQSVLSDLGLEGLDGELCVGPYNAQDLMQRTTSGVMSQSGEPDFTYYVFDLWVRPDLGFDKRIEMLNEAFNNDYWAKHSRKHIKLLPQARLENREEVERFETLCLEQGFEGIMLRKFDAPYKYGRATTKQQWLVKVKRFVDDEAVVIGFQEFMHNANELEEDNLGYAKRSSHQANKIPMNTLGALLVRDCKTGIEFAIGTGYDAATRQRIWNHQPGFSGKIVKYKHFANAGVKDAPRFPVFLGFRDPSDMS